MYKEQYGCDITNSNRNRFEEIMKDQEMDNLYIYKNKNRKGVICLVLGIIGLFAWIIPVVGFIIGMFGLLLSIRGLLINEVKTLSTIGLFLSINCLFNCVIRFVLMLM